MQKYLLYIFIGLLSCSNCYAQLYKNDLEKRNLKGKVKVMKQISDQVKMEAGQIVKITSNSGVEWGGIHVYGVSDVIHFNKNGFEELHYVGRGTNKDEYKSLIISNFNHNGFKIKSIKYRNTGEVWGYTKYSYNATGLLTDKEDFIFYKPNITTYKYDSKGQLERERKNDGNTKLFFYDAKGHLIRTFDGWDDVHYKRDTEGNLIEEIQYNADGEWDHTIYYNQYGDIHKTLDKYQRVGYCEYKYDSFGNWIELKYYEGEKKAIKGISKREIEYYN